ncbi:MAG: hypothetical protein WED34_20495, partial [Planctomycetales bacterium]
IRARFGMIGERIIRPRMVPAASKMDDVEGATDTDGDVRLNGLEVPKGLTTKETRSASPLVAARPRRLNGVAATPRHSGSAPDAPSVRGAGVPEFEIGF